MNAFISMLCDADLRASYDDMKTVCSIITVGMILDGLEAAENASADLLRVQAV